MKLAKGRGIKFFKHPAISMPKTFVVNTLGYGKKHIKNAVNGVVNISNNIIKKGGKKS